MKLKLIAVIASSFLVGATVAIFLNNRETATITVKTSGKALVGGPFSMIDQTGKPVTEKDFSGRYSLVFFGYTHCPDVCPATLQVTSDALEKLGAQADRIQPVFVSVDPERDTPEVLKDYLENFDPRLIGLTGTVDQVRAMIKTYRVYVARVPDTEAEGEYTMDHSAFMYLMSPDGNYLTHFSYGITGADLAVKLRPILQQG